MARYLKSLIYIIHLPPFINHLKITLKSSTETKFKPFYCITFVIAPIKGFCLVSEMHECTTEFSK